MNRIVPLSLLVVTVAASSALLSAYVAVGRVPTDAPQSLISTGVALALVFWIMADARMRRRTPCYDFGFLVAVFFPASLFWYVLWSRGRRGLLTLVALVGLWFVPWLSAMVAWVLRYGPP